MEGEGENGQRCARLTTFTAGFDQINSFFIVGFSLVGYILKQLFTSVEVNSTGIPSLSGQSESAKTLFTGSVHTK